MVSPSHVMFFFPPTGLNHQRSVPPFRWKSFNQRKRRRSQRRRRSRREPRGRVGRLPPGRGRRSSPFARCIGPRTKTEDGDGDALATKSLRKRHLENRDRTKRCWRSRDQLEMAPNSFRQPWQQRNWRRNLFRNRICYITESSVSSLTSLGAVVTHVFLSPLDAKYSHLE